MKYYKPSPRILNRRHCQFSSSKESKDIEEAKVKDAERRIQKEEKTEKRVERFDSKKFSIS